MIPPSVLINCNNLSSCLQNLYNLLFAFLVAFAFFYFIWGAIEYLFSGISITHKETGKRKMINSIVGLILALIIPTFLYMISPDIFRLTWKIPIVTVSFEPPSLPYSFSTEYPIEDVIKYAREACRKAGFVDLSALLAILQIETNFGKNIGSTIGNREQRINTCVGMCTDPNYAAISSQLVYCYDPQRARKNWCQEQYNALERIGNKLGLDITQLPTAPDFGMGPAQFQPTTWEVYSELRYRNPWKIKDAAYAIAIYLKNHDFLNNEQGAICSYNCGSWYWGEYITAKNYWREKGFSNCQ